MTAKPQRRRVQVLLVFREVEFDPWRSGILDGLHSVALDLKAAVRKASSRCDSGYTYQVLPDHLAQVLRESEEVNRELSGWIEYASQYVLLDRGRPVRAGGGVGLSKEISPSTLFCTKVSSFLWSWINWIT